MKGIQNIGHQRSFRFVAFFPLSRPFQIRPPARRAFHASTEYWGKMPARYDGLGCLQDLNPLGTTFMRTCAKV